MSNPSNVLVVIPARMGSTRYPRKPLAVISGKLMIERVWEIGKAAANADKVVIATDSEEIKEVAESFGAEVLLTSEACTSGSERVCEAAALLGHTEGIVCSLQGDAVLTPPWVLEATIEELKRDQSIQISTPAVKLEGAGREEFVRLKRAGSTSGTSVVFDNQRNALYFSKGLIPFERPDARSDVELYRHIGLYCYRAQTLSRLCALPMSSLEKAEKLEQLRALENGIPIRVVLVDYRGRTHASVDTPEDVRVVEALIDKEGELLR